MADKNKQDNRGWHGDPEGHAQAGKKGGETTKAKHGPDFYSAIGEKGGETSGGNKRQNSGSKGNKGRK